MGMPLYYHIINISTNNITFIAQVKYKCDSIENINFLLCTSFCVVLSED